MKPLFVAVNDSSAIQVVGTQLHGYAVARQNTNEVLAHSSRDMGQHLVVILELDLEHGIGQGLNDRCHYLNRVFLRQTVSRFCRALTRNRRCYGNFRATASCPPLNQVDAPRWWRQHWSLGFEKLQP